MFVYNFAASTFDRQLASSLQQVGLWLQRQLPSVSCEEGSCTWRVYSEFLCHYLYWRQHGTQNHDMHAPISATWMDTIKVEFGNNHAFPWVLSTYAKPREKPLWPNTEHYYSYEAFVSMVTCLHCYWLLIGMWSKSQPHNYIHMHIMLVPVIWKAMLLITTAEHMGDPSTPLNVWGAVLILCSRCQYLHPLFQVVPMHKPAAQPGVGPLPLMSGHVSHLWPTFPMPVHDAWKSQR